jgi:hypothetical protein
MQYHAMPSMGEQKKIFGIICYATYGRTEIVFGIIWTYEKDTTAVGADPSHKNTACKGLRASLKLKGKNISTVVQLK